jgi:hypothetical protein
MADKVGLEPVGFGDFLVQRRVIDEGQLLDALADHWLSGRPIEEAVVKRGYLTGDQMRVHLKEFEALDVVYV